MAKTTQIVSDATFSALSAKGLVLVDFWAAWCGPCKAIAPKLEEIANELGDKVSILKLNVDENPETTAKFQIRSIPSLILFKEGQVVDQIMGNMAKEQLLSFIAKHQ